ncbi:type I polyketide synthase [Phaeobacter sp. 22II1-1F12B]|uniref:type I polyketide synthase n=1 Tax=Phaeobacter sp. 22II1-1F12B TaxID=1317111 RepID=UPI000B5201E2|nr:type I polyketide synthase [Phaeobacter sp. 22II1-1F12B]OWU78228.1 hypothetical protein ATO1_14695 [Phaeobacter sp. 22II1-1F12B]
MNQIYDPSRSAAIVGIGLRFPGGLSSTEEFWRFLMDGGDAITEIPADRMDMGRLYDPTPAKAGHITTRFGGFLEDIDRFDARFFGIAPREAESMDPGQRLVLETAWEAIEDAGLDAAQLRDRPVGVFVGQWVSDFEARLLRHEEAMDFRKTSGSGRYATPGRLSYCLGLQGPSLSIDTACASSLTAVHLALQSLRSGESEMAFAAGVNIILSPHITIGFSQSRMMAPDGRCKFGDAGGDGYVRSEGAGMLLLKRLDRALADGDRIHAVVRGSAVNNDGRSGQSFGTPGRGGQEQLLRSALADAGAEARQISYVEAHGTGTRKGDPVELGAIGEIVGDRREGKLLVGSVKTNIGHTEGAAGLAGLIKTALILKHGKVPPSLHLETPNPEVDWDGMSVAIPKIRQTLPESETGWLAGVNSFGIAGSNSHVVLQSPPAPNMTRGNSHCVLTGFKLVLPISAQTGSGLQALAGRYLEATERAGDAELAKICAAASQHRTGLMERAVLGGFGSEGVLTQLRALAAGENSGLRGLAPEVAPKVVFVAPGQGGQWQGMARELLKNSPVFSKSIADCSKALSKIVDWQLEEVLTVNGLPENNRIDVIQPTLVALAISYANLLKAMGIHPDMVIGHSMGEVAAAAISGSLTLDDAMRIVAKRSLLMADLSGTGGMALVELVGEALEARLRQYPELGLAARNGPRSSVVSGETGALDKFLAEVEHKGIFCRRVHVDVASHSPQMEPLAAQLSGGLVDLTAQAGEIPMISTVFGCEVTGTELVADYWGENLRKPVLFDAAVRKAIGAGGNVFVELGPHPVLLPSIKDIGGDLGETVHAYACGKRDVDNSDAMVACAAGLWTVGCPLDWRSLYGENPRRTDLPGYPWQRERYWVQEAEIGFGAHADRLPQPDAETIGWLYHVDWQPTEIPSIALEAGLSDWLVVGDGPEDGVALAIRDALGVNGARVRVGCLDDVGGEDLNGLSIMALAPKGRSAARLPVALSQSLQAGGFRPRQLVYVTRGAMTPDIGETAKQGDPDQAALWGAARVVAQEQPEPPIRMIDLDPTEEPARTASLLVQSLVGLPDEDELALRGKDCFLPRLKGGLAAPSARALPWRADAACLITGGLGGVGTRVARRVAAEGARHLVLLGRTPLPPRAEWQTVAAESPASRAIANICSIEACGASVHYIASDVSDETVMQEALTAYAAERRPPIRALIHAAGNVRNGLAAQMNEADFDAVLRAKLEGAKVLDRLLPDLDLFVVFSSIAATLAPIGMANYAAANTGAEAIAERRRQQGQPALSIGWSAWDGTGMHEQTGDFTDSSELERVGARTLGPDQLEPLMGSILRSKRSAIIMDLDWSTFAATADRKRAIFGELVRAAGPAPVLISALPENATPQERRALILNLVRRAAGSVLQIAADTIDPDVAFGSLGLNSLMAMELRAELERKLGRRLPATLAWNYPTVTALARHLAENSEDAPAEKRREGSVKETAPQDAGFSFDDLAEALADSSDDYLAVALRPKRTGVRG